MKKRVALITGITGQDGSYLAEFLLKKKYIVHGIKRRSSLINTQRIDHIYKEPWIKKRNFILHYGDLTDSSNISFLINQIKPDEIYNLGAQSHVKTSFDQPEYTSNVNALGTLRILESMRLLNLKKKIKLYQASTSELYGEAKKKPQDELTPFNPASPYATSKLFAYWICKNYRDAYNIFVCNGILFNHESERRGETFVTRKITIGLSKLVLGLQKKLYLGNLDALRDWGHAKDYAEMQYLILQQKKPDDYVIATGKQHSVREFIHEALSHFGIELKWSGKGLQEKGVISRITKNEFKSKDIKIGKEIIAVSKEYFRPNEVPDLLGNAKKARRKLKWKYKIGFKELVRKMIISDYNKLSNET